MKRTISAMVGKGSVSHNRREFNAENTDPERSHLNRCYADEPIREVYHQLFDEATTRYNDRQTRADRKIDDYYEKIRTSKQEKLFHEVIFQIGNKDDTGVGTPDGDKAVEILDEFAKEFQKRNPNLYLFSTHLHMDEATPHLHLDFVPFTTGSKRGLDTRVSLKSALAAQGLTGSGRQETEWSKWILSEKEELAQVMERHGIEWEKLGTRDEHLSVLNYKKEQRAKEVTALENKIGNQKAELSGLAQQKQELRSEIKSVSEKHDKIKNHLAKVEHQESLIMLNVRRYDEEPKWQLPEPSALMTAKTYKTKVVEPFIMRLKTAIRSIVTQYLKLKSSVNDLQSALYHSQEHVESLTDRLIEAKDANKQLREVARDFGRVKKILGEDKVKHILKQAKEKEISKMRVKPIRNIRER
jgi:hypothetical protein